MKAITKTAAAPPIDFWAFPPVRRVNLFQTQTDAPSEKRSAITKLLIMLILTVLVVAGYYKVRTTFELREGFASMDKRKTRCLH